MRHQSVLVQKLVALSAVLGALSTAVLMHPVGAAPATILYTDINDANASPAVHDVTEIGPFGSYYTVSDTAQLGGNDVLSILQNGNSACCHGVTVLARISNGENGIDVDTNGNADIPNPDPVNSVFAAIGNSSGRLEDGNVIRVSAWFRSDPSNPITVDPQVQPVLKIEFWKESFSGNGDFSSTAPFPGYGDRLFDTDQQRELLGVADKAQWIDFDGDGIVNDPDAASEGRVSSLTTSAWTLVETVYEIDAVNDFWGIGSTSFGAGDVTVVETIQATMFVGDFANTNVTGDGNGGIFLMDNLLIEVFKDVASVTPNTNPDPDASAAGDFDGDGDVDGADFLKWQRDDGTAGGLSQWQGNYPSPLVAATAVPEPMSVLLVAIGLMGMAASRGKSH